MKNISETFNRYNYLIDTHTAVANKVLDDYRAETNDNTPTVVVSTASPYKFCDSVLKALGNPPESDSIMLIDELHKVTNTEVPKPLASLHNSKPRFTDVITKTDMKKSVKQFIEVE